MRFETLPSGEAAGTVLAHSVRAAGRLLKKGRYLTANDVTAVAEAGFAHVMVVRLEADDIGEDEAAASIAQAFRGPNIREGSPFTGRANLYAEAAGLVVLSPESIDAANLVHESITIATLPPYAEVMAGDMVATVKIIPFAAPKDAVASVLALVGRAPITVAPFASKTAALVSTILPGQKASLLEKSRASLETRLAPLGGRLLSEAHCPHTADAVSAALREAMKSGADMLFVMGASAISDRRDVVPAGIVRAGGTILHFGMPVDPGNLLLLGTLDGKPVVGLPGCARSPKRNGFDFVLQRLFAGIAMAPKDIMKMGVGGLLTEIPSRPQPRAGDEARDALRAPRIAAIVLAAGLSSRMGHNKLLAPVRGVPLLRRTVETALQSQARPVVVVTGHDHANITPALSDLDIVSVHNPNYAQGLSTSLRAGLGAVPASCDGALVLLGDMPELRPSTVDRMIAAFSPADRREICVATADGKRGNPVLWARRFFSEMETIAGDNGAKHLLGLHEELVCEIEADESVLRDIDTPEALAGLEARLSAVAAP